MTEKDLEHRLCNALRGGFTGGNIPVEFFLHNSNSDAQSLLDLIGHTGFDLIEDDSRWNLAPKFMIEIIGGMTPDIVLRSKASGENRIYIEVKKTQPLGYGKADSQIVRYFLHLIATSHSNPLPGQEDIRRAVLLAAPPSWLDVKVNRESWTYFLQTYSGLATCLGVTLAEIHLSE